MNFKKITSIFGMVMILTFGFVNYVHAHIVVRPAEVGVGVRQNFIVGFSVEKDIPTTGVRLIIPEQIKSVTPYLKPGWQINIQKSGEGEDARVTEISWTGGSVGPGFRDEFLFSAQAPAEEGILIWKGYQTYSDGSVVAWDLDPSTIVEEEESSTHDEDHESGPWSETEVINDLVAGNEAVSGDQTGEVQDTSAFDPALAVGGAALVLSIASIWMQKKKNKK